jgi:ATP-binding cassette subfamily B protein
MSMGTFFRTMMRYLRPYWPRCLALLFLLLIDVGFTTAWPLGFMTIIDTVLPAQDERLLAIVLGALLAGVLVAAIASLGRDYLYAYLSSNVLHDIRIKVFAHLQRLSLDFYSRVGTGDIMARFSSDLSAVETAVTWAMASLLLNSLTIVLGTVLMFGLEWRLAILTVVGLIGCVVVPHSLARKAAVASYDAKKRQAGLSDTIQENIGAQSLVKAFGLEKRSSDSFRQQSLHLAQASRRFGFLSYVVERLPNVVIMIFEIVVIGTGILLVFYGERKLGTIVAFHAIFLNITASVGGISAVMPVILQSLGGLARIEEVLNEKPRILDAPDAYVLPRVSQGLAFSDVRFGYKDDQLNLNGASFEIRKGDFVALVGGSGSGKSTILNLILRFYDPAGGTITFDQRDVRGVTQESLRSQIGIVFQDSILFNISVRENIRLGHPLATAAEIEAAMRAAEIHDFVAGLPEGYDTIAGERGSRFSGGQRQRLALARALVRNPAILLLDEATSALDPGSEAAINETLVRVAKGRTVISVTHRLSTIADADRIFVLDGGQIGEQGKHAELLQRRGTYARLWRKQAGFTLNPAGDQAGVDIGRLKDIPILAQLDEEILAELPDQFVTERYPAGRRVIVQGDPGNRFYILVRGKVDVVREEVDGAETRIAVLHDGDYFGEIALLDDVPRTASIITRTPSVFLSLERAEFSGLLNRAPGLRETLLKTYADRQPAKV